MEYKIISDDKISVFEERINALLKKGWKLQGGTSACFVVSSFENYIEFYQAMIKE